MGNKRVISTYTITNTDFENSIIIDGTVEPIRFTNMLCPGNVDAIVTYLIDDGTYVEEGDIVCILEDNEQQTNYNNMKIELENAIAELSKVRADLKMQYALLEAQVKNNDVDTEIADLDSLQLKFATPIQKRIKELELERAYIQKANLQQKLDALDIINKSEIRKMEINIQQLTNRLQSAGKTLDELTVRASKKGLAIIPTSRMTGEKLKVGDNVWNNMPVVTIPEMEQVKVKMSVNETDFRHIGDTDSVAYTFDAMPGNSGYGRIIKKLPVGQPRSRESKVKFFEVEASIDSVLQLPEPGFTAKSRIISIYISDTIVVPQIAIYEVDSMKVVYVRNNNDKYEMRQISTGPSSMKESIVTAGLRKGEVVSLIKPPASLIRGKKVLSDSIR
ncbi:efflux RND transporter periplasmic adaptor subunit [Proteiniphilum sp.]|uniref:efflux RND transporter periplasmic adaptor subunit n=1 Tax=Proteiniphilum sp. TaxID=1926877 RepID=UPI002B1EADF8|nr:efflux RND transporter periplasmic adaptor subunit [Proteiniphilum sp.]MEA4916113.1 efflux RND transporter periplasmic adaptor subunit [Proteiniphilum sp.]